MAGGTLAKFAKAFQLICIPARRFGRNLNMRASHKVLLSFVLFCLLGWHAVTRGISPANSQAVGMRDFGNRLEGTTTQLNALSDFTFVALHRHFERFSKDSTLSVSFFLPSVATDNTRVFLEALELQDSLHYFMSSKQGNWQSGAWNTFHPWPTKDVIDPYGIASDNVGVRAAYQIGKQTRVYLPVDIQSSNGLIGERTYTFYYVTAQDLQSIEISVTNLKGETVSIRKPTLECNKKRNPNCLLFAAGNTFNFALDFSALPEGQYFVQLIGRIPRTSRTASALVSLYHPSQSEKSR
jgi:hypothetical protein